MNDANPTFEEAFRIHRDHLHVLGRRLAGNDAEAEDLVQETLLRAYVHRSRFEPGTNVRAWLGRILRNLFIDRRRKAMADRRLEERLVAEPMAHEEYDPGREIDRGRTRRHIHVALRQLPNGFREAVELVDLEDQDYATAAARIGCPEGTVMSRVHRGRKRLAELLAPFDPQVAQLAS